jgi:hypothetical protein
MDRYLGDAEDIDEEMIPNEPTLSRLERSINRLCSLSDVRALGSPQVLYILLLLHRLISKAEPVSTLLMYLCKNMTSRYMYIHVEALSASVELGLVLNIV